MVYISNRKDLLNYCESNNIRPEAFNEPITLKSDFVNTFDGENSYEHLLYDDEKYEDYLSSIFYTLDSPPEKLSKEERLARYDLFVHGLFYGFTSFNSELNISAGIDNISGLLDGATSFNREFIIPVGVKNVSRLFRNCKSYNQITILPTTVINVENMFEGCSAYNQTFIIPDGVKSCEGLFMNCSSYNQDTVIPDTVTDTITMFYGCVSFNSNTNIPLAELESHSYKGLNGKFNTCSSFTEPYWCMFVGCDSLNWDNVVVPGKYNTSEIRDKIYKWAFKKETGLKYIPKGDGSGLPEDAYSCKNLDEPINIPNINPFEPTSLF